MDTLHEKLMNHASIIQECLAEIDDSTLIAVRQLLIDVRKRRGRVFVGGNGGSAAITEHLACDWQKGAFQPPGLHVVSMTANSALTTAIANDCGYELLLAKQLEFNACCPNDVVLLISSSGNSKNIIEGAFYAKNNCVKLIGFTGFTGGKLKPLSDFNFHIGSHDYGVVEDAHQILMHVLARSLK